MNESLSFQCFLKRSMIPTMKKRLYILLSVIVITMPLFFTGCNGNTIMHSVSQQASVSKKIAGKQIIVMLGNDYAVRPTILASLITKYGDARTGGLILPMYYPQSFIVDKRLRLSLLSDAVEKTASSIVVTVGAPEGTVRELAKIRNSHPEMQIISIFSLDEIFPVEAVSSLVLDSPISSDLLAAESSTVISDAEIEVLILAAVLSAEETDIKAPALERFTYSLETAKSVLKQNKVGSDWKFSAFVDTETNLRSANHLVFECKPGKPE